MSPHVAALASAMSEATGESLAPWFGSALPQEEAAVLGPLHSLQVSEALAGAVRFTADALLVSISSSENGPLWERIETEHTMINLEALLPRHLQGADGELFPDSTVEFGDSVGAKAAQEVESLIPSVESINVTGSLNTLAEVASYLLLFLL